MKRDTFWLMATLVSLISLGAVELFEQITFVPNWLVGNVAENTENFRRFYHTTEPGMFHFPVSTIVLISYIMMVRKSTHFAKDRASRTTVWKSFAAFLLTYAISVFIITAINVPVFTENSVPAEDLPGLMNLWAWLNFLRVVLPAYAVYQLLTLMSIKAATPQSA